ncbi:MAG: hypothetical protein LBV69_03350 [Bacteroidales bacterium]|jgi:hypothetical protein|nr:hypothetical protein [Bacteroidales bacterium]
MKKAISLLILLSIYFFSFSQTQIFTNKYQEFAMFVSGQEFPSSIDTTKIKTDFWKKYKEKLNVDWLEIDTSRLSVMQEWQMNEISTKINDTLNLLYPFSGPDFLHAYLLFPNAKNYLLLAQEHLGKIPDFSKMKQVELEQFLDKFYFSIRDIFQRSYFITNRMNTDLNNSSLQGVLPVILFFLAKTEHSIVDVKYEKLTTSLDFQEFTTNPSGVFSSGESIIIKFFNNSDTTKQIKSLRYFRCDISDEGLKNAPNFSKFLSNQTQINSYTKSASYCLHNSNFSIIRNIMLKNSDAILQDDTGIPYRFFTILEWTPFLFGKYEKPIADFKGDYLIQNDLMKKYELEIDIYPLPFSLGYHWKTGAQNQMLFIKK